MHVGPLAQVAGQLLDGDAPVGVLLKVQEHRGFEVDINVRAEHLATACCNLLWMREGPA